MCVRRLVVANYLSPCLASSDNEVDFLPQSQDCNFDIELDGGSSPGILSSDDGLPPAWQIGVHTGGHVELGSFNEGEQTLIANIVHNLDGVRAPDLKRFANTMGVDAGAVDKGQYGWVISVASRLLGLTQARWHVRKCYDAVKSNGWVPVAAYHHNSIEELGGVNNNG